MKVFKKEKGVWTQQKAFIKASGSWIAVSEKEESTYTITFIANGLTYSKKSIIKGSSVTAESFPSNPIRSEWTFEGWYINENTRFSVETVVTKDLTVTAKWSQSVQTGTEIRDCEDCLGIGILVTVCPVCDGTGIIANACNNCGIDLGKDWTLDETPNCPKCNANLSTPNAVNPDTECYGACEGTGDIYEDCSCDNGQREYPVYETVTVLY